MTEGTGPVFEGHRTKDGWDVLALASELVHRGEEFALATVVWRQAPSSGQPGARAIITSAGVLHGWIGGACAEPAVLREARQAISSGEPRLLLLGTPEQFGDSVPDGMRVVPISCQSEGALQVYVEPVVPVPHLVVVGRSPMAHTLVRLATVLDWRAELLDVPDVDAARVGRRSVVIVATQGHGDEEAVAAAVDASPGFVGLVASAKRGRAVLGYLADRGVPAERLARVVAPVGLDLGHTSHREIAVAILAELVQMRAAGRFSVAGSAEGTPTTPTHEHAVDPVCGMSVRADPASHPVEMDGATYYFCCVGCRDAFVANPAAYPHRLSPLEA
jgi:xanthine dehydrogenase accessory factor